MPATVDAVKYDGMAEAATLPGDLHHVRAFVMIATGKRSFSARSAAIAVSEQINSLFDTPEGAASAEPSDFTAIVRHQWIGSAIDHDERHRWRIARLDPVWPKN